MKFISICKIWSFIFLIVSISLFFIGGVFLFKEMSFFIEWEIISLNSCIVNYVMLFDWMSILFLSLVIFISSMVLIYSEEYMHLDKTLNRFVLIIVMFVLSMVFLIISPSMISILLGWDGLGLVSYCLVIYFQNVKSYNAGMSTILFNRIGDISIIFSIIMLMNMGSWNLILFMDYMCMSEDFMWLGMLLMLAAMTKSAQIPFSSWLPAAMAAPTPVSALVHSSTLVTAGVYLLIRYSVMFNFSFFMNFLLLGSTLTMVMSGLGANFEYDLKSIVALSTLSQLGLMLSVLSLGYVKLAFFHLLTHAMFKALLFMCSGSMIHSMKDMQDIRSMGGMSFYLPVTVTCFNVANLSLSGMPFLAGFYSKDLMMEMACMSYLNYLIFFFFFFSIGLTVSYTFRLIYYSLNLTYGSVPLIEFSDGNWYMIKGMLGLIVLSVMGGSGLNWLIFSSSYLICLPLSLKLLTIMNCILGMMVGYGYALLSMNLYWQNSYFNYYYYFKHYLGEMWFMGVIFSIGISYYPLVLGFKMYKMGDQGWSEYLGGQKIYYNLNNLNLLFQFMQFNTVSVYLMMFILIIIFFYSLLII